MLTLLLIAACTIGSDAPAPSGSIASQEAIAVGELARDAQEISRLAAELTALVDESRRQVDDGRSTPQAEIAKMRELMVQIEDLNTALQQDGEALQERLHDQANDPAWPPGDPPEAD